MTFAEHRTLCARCNEWALVHIDKQALSATPPPPCVMGEAILKDTQGDDPEELAVLNANLDPVVEVDGDSGGVTTEATMEMHRTDD